MLIESFAELLERYAPADGREREYLGRMRALVRAPAPFDRACFAPGHFTASAFVLDARRSSLLLILHKKLGLWLQPGGHVELGDTGAAAAARREVLEETGVAALEPLLARDELFDLDIHRIPARRAELEHEHFDVRFAFVAPDDTLVQSDEVAGARWIPLGEVSSVTADESIVRAVHKLMPHAARR